MLAFFAALALLFIGCYTYGRLAESLLQGYQIPELTL